MIINIHPQNPQENKIKSVVELLKQGGIIIYPTDSMYALGCDINSQEGIERICTIKNLDPTRAMLSFMCTDISQLSNYTSQIPNSTYRFIKKNTPGPVTFILNGSNKLPRMFKNKKRTIGARIPDSVLIQEMLSQLGNPLLSTTLDPTENHEYYFNSIDAIQDEYENRVDAIVDCGIVSNDPTSVVDCTKEPLEIIREGAIPLYL